MRCECKWVNVWVPMIWKLSGKGKLFLWKWKLSWKCRERWLMTFLLFSLCPTCLPITSPAQNCLQFELTEFYFFGLSWSQHLWICSCVPNFNRKIFIIFPMTCFFLFLPCFFLLQPDFSHGFVVSLHINTTGWTAKLWQFSITVFSMTRQNCYICRLKWFLEKTLKLSVRAI